MPNPPDENTMINTKTGWRTQFNSVTLKEGRSARSIPVNTLYQKEE